MESSQRPRSRVGRLYAVLVVALLAAPAAARGRKRGKPAARATTAAKTCTNINVGAKPCSGSGTYKSLIDYAGSSAGQSAASADLATQLTDYSSQEIDWAKAVAAGSCKALPTCNGAGRTDGVKGRKDITNKVRLPFFSTLRLDAQICGQSGSKFASAYSGWSISYLTTEQRRLC